MSTDFQVQEVTTPEELLSIADDWDDLWLRSEVTVPRARAALVAQWLRHFHADGSFCAFTVWHDGRLVAALPLVTRRWQGMFRMASLPSNPWASCGDLLVDRGSDVASALKSLAEAVLHSQYRVLWLEHARLDAPRWLAMVEAFQHAGVDPGICQQYTVGEVELGPSWADYETTRKGDHRRSRRRYARMLEKVGKVALKTYPSLAPDEVCEFMERGFEVEDRSWKGEQGTSVCKEPGMLDYFVGEARQLARWESLDLAFLELDDEPIAFQYGWNSKRVYFTPKLGFDAAYRKFGPGQQLMMRQLERLHEQRPCDRLDFHGPLAQWSSSWATHTYPVGRIVVAARGMLNHRLLRAYERWQPRLREVRRRWRPSRHIVDSPAA